MSSATNSRELGADYYNQRYATALSSSIYNNVYRAAAQRCRGRVLDMGCGRGEMRQFLDASVSYDGFDFAERALSTGLRKGDL